MRIITNDDLENYAEFLTVGELKKAIENMDDDAKVLVQRIEDKYYTENGWSVLLKEAYSYRTAIHLSNEMREEVNRRLKGEEPHYPDLDNPETFILDENNIDAMNKLKEQYHPAFCVVKYKNDKNLFLDLHY